MTNANCGTMVRTARTARQAGRLRAARLQPVLILQVEMSAGESLSRRHTDEPRGGPVKSACIRNADEMTGGKDHAVLEF